LRYGSASRCCNRSLRRARALVARPKRRSRKHLQQLRRSIQSREHAAELLTVAVQRSLRRRMPCHSGSGSDFAAVVNLVKGRWPEHYCSI
jgi:hypothetical protein